MILLLCVHSFWSDHRSPSIMVLKIFCCLSLPCRSRDSLGSYLSFGPVQSPIDWVGWAWDYSDKLTVQYKVLVLVRVIIVWKDWCLLLVDSASICFRMSNRLVWWLRKSSMLIRVENIHDWLLSPFVRACCWIAWQKMSLMLLWSHWIWIALIVVGIALLVRM